ncbi:hypothetical protein [Paraburkholderia sp. SIMBA_054]|uniref:hypothetical protein n=1 Tax=Paraburkholderia sp. SIMBA_054 TaxID=3085795 RepID=UPI00397A5DC4
MTTMTRLQQLSIFIALNRLLANGVELKKAVKDLQKCDAGRADLWEAAAERLDESNSLETLADCLRGVVDDEVRMLVQLARYEYRSNTLEAVVQYLTIALQARVSESQ